MRRWRDFIRDFWQDLGRRRGDPWRAQRGDMVRGQIAARGVRDARVLAAMDRVPRHLFLPASVRALAYEDQPLDIGHEQTISQPYVVAVMLESLGLTGTERVLEIGTGSGYQAALLAELAAEVFSVERIPELAQQARQTLGLLGGRRAAVRTGNGWDGWPEQAPFDAVIVSAGSDRVPPALADQLRPGGRLVMPLGSPDRQDLVRFAKTEAGLKKEILFPVRFVPFVKPENA